MPDVLGFDQRNVEVGLHLLQKIGGPEPRVASAHDRDVSGGVRLKGGRDCGTLEAIPPQ